MLRNNADAPTMLIFRARATREEIWNNNNNSHSLGTGGRHGRRHGNVKGRCACEIIYGIPERQKKSYLKGYLATIKRLML